MSPLLLALLVTFSVVLLAGFCVLAVALRNSRPGYEDATGFHEDVLPELSGQVMPVRVRTAAPAKAAVRDGDIGRPVLAG